MSVTGQVNARLRSTNEILAMATALEEEAARRYRALCERMTRQGDTEMAELFESLARMEDSHARQVCSRAPAASLAGIAQHVRWERPPGFDEAEARGASLSPYQALAFAVRNEERAFAFYTYVAAEAETPDIRAMAEDLARDELDHASLLRKYRRRAFHDNRPAAIEIPQTVSQLHAFARRRDAQAAAAHRALAAALRGQGEIEDAARFDRLADEEAKSAGDAADGSEAPRLDTATDGLRLLEQTFDYFALVAERAGDEAIVAEAQRLASGMVSRMALTGGSRNNSLLQAKQGQDSA